MDFAVASPITSEERIAGSAGAPEPCGLLGAAVAISPPGER
jgi:hypothetical protein